MYYIRRMVQPKTPPLSIRFSPGVLADLKAEAERRGVKVNALVVRAVQKEIGQWSDEEIAAMRAKPRPPPLEINMIAPLKMPRAAPGSRLKKPKGSK